MIDNLFDYYSLRARLQPALLTLVPLALGTLSWSQPESRWVYALWSLLGTVGFTYFIANIARNRGKNIEPGLWKSWDGAPTTQLLRHSGTANSVLRERWHKQLSKLLGKPFPSIHEEKQDPAQADEIYAAVTRLLIGKTRDTKTFPLIYKESVSYGFCRNLYAMRGLGITATLLGFAASVSAGLWSLKEGKVEYLPWACAIVCAALLLWWIFTVTSEWVKVPAMNYAQHLFESTEKLTYARKMAQLKRT